ncbi:Predicted membrane protein [Slackia heliotrinireducens]|uniref:F5/8 type C domain-containing protein n=1 Tax=Slackia heliotrinireducens (strain ATCC 29202 / DSM 20476 / NCTC 11029 / RHS 1) TaxID=471855 RepID=C7N6X6_SLAHD|nr:zinc-ribbon domain-containing protein [Slackia heliotrinireducens]ACV22661.1 F5/8 type C domain-containing protein [Slackia heliotrinireducens DSM 20476]VEH01230.1 Predicted membrane protein [Slackia heliotrinireducens]
MSQQFCTSCGAPVQEGRNFCTSCGAPVASANTQTEVRKPSTQQRICPNCHAAVADGMPFCTSCGHYLDAPVAAPPTQPTAKGPNKTLVAAVAAAVIIVAAVAATLAIIQPWAHDEPDAKSEPAVAHKADKDDAETEDASDATADSDGAADATADSEEEPQADPANTDAAKEEALDASVPAVFDHVRASSELPPDEYNSYYGVNNAVDNDMATAWNEGNESNNGEGEWIEIYADTEQVCTQVRFVPGYPKSELVYNNNCRPKNVTVSFSDGTSIDVEIEDIMGQEITLDLDKPVKTTFVRLTINEVFPGDQWTDCTVAEFHAS